jgi:hypothetical protein
VQLCASATSEIAEVVNTAQQRLLYCREAGEEGWWGTWAEMVFNVATTDPYITTPREVARLQSMTVCDAPIPLNNQFYEYLQFGNGTLPALCGVDCPRVRSGYTRNNVVTFTDMTSAPQLLRAYITEAQDEGKRILFQGTDSTGSVIYSQDLGNRVTGMFVDLESPFATTPITFNTLTGIQKDVTAGQVSIYQVDASTGAEVLLLTMEPGETTASYRRYYLDSLPSHCCANDTTIQVKAIAKLELIPVRVDTDYCLIQNKEAIIEEAQAVRYSEVDTAGAKQLAQEKHMQAVRLLNGELNHYVGKNSVAIKFSPFGTADLNRVNIGMI